jgi:hypothetical protein
MSIGPRRRRRVIRRCRLKARMKTHFSTAAEYLAHLQELYTRRYSSGTPVDAEFQRLTEESLSARGIELPHHPVSGIGSVVENIWRDILNALEKSVRDVTKPCIAAGVVENGKANAFIVKSPDGKYAIIFNSGLGIFLHKLFKITSGCVEPQSVTYCNRKSANLLTRGDMRAYLDEYINYYRENGVPRGPLIKLTQKASATAALQLNASELFILCHELGHFLNGDLDNECLYSAFGKYRSPYCPLHIRFRDSCFLDKHYQAFPSAKRRPIPLPAVDKPASSGSFHITQK